jgi:hypothetical protein
MLGEEPETIPGDLEGDTAIEEMVSVRMDRLASVKKLSMRWRDREGASDVEGPLE